MAQPFITLDQAAGIAGVTIATVRRWVSTGVSRADGTRAKLLAIRVTGQECTSEVVLRDFLRENKAGAKAKA